MLRAVGMLILIIAGAALGAVGGMIAGAAFVEFGKSACSGAACADAIAKTYIPLGAGLGALAALGKALAMRPGRV